MNAISKISIILALILCLSIVFVACAGDEEPDPVESQAQSSEAAGDDESEPDADESDPEADESEADESEPEADESEPEADDSQPEDPGVVDTEPESGLQNVGAESGQTNFGGLEEFN